MQPISPALTASSSATAYNPSPFDNVDISMDKLDDFSELFDFDQFESSSSSHTHSPKTISPNHTPSPLPMSASPFAFDASMSAFDFGNPDSDFFDLNTIEKAPPAPVREEIVIKQEPVEFGFSTAPSQALPPQATPIATQSYDFSGLPNEQQRALQELLANMIQYQSQYGLDIPATSVASTPAAMGQSGTVQPAMLFNNVANPLSTSAASSSSMPQTVPVAPLAPIAPAVEFEHDDEPLIAVEEHEENRSSRQESTFSSVNDDLDSKIDALVPLPTIFSAGRGKGGKKGGGMSSVVRAEDEDIDDDDSWRPSPEEYKKLSSKEKRQLRNKLSARAFRNRRKDYIGTLEGHIKDRDNVIDAIKAELVNSRSENQDLRRELAALKAATMATIHQEEVKPQRPNLKPTSSFTSQPVRRTPTPKFDVRKDVPSSSAAFSAWNNNHFGGGSTICHTMLTPDVTLPTVKPTLRTFADLPRVNLNPNLNEDVPRMPSLQAKANETDLNGSFSEWSENNAFSLRSMDSYRIQMWSRLAREAASQKSHIPTESRPKFYVESQYAQAAQTHISTKLASSFWSAFSSSGSGLDADKLTAVVTGKAKLKVVDINQEKDDADLLAAALGSLKLQSGLSRSESQVLRVRENPLGALHSFFCPARV